MTCVGLGDGASAEVVGGDGVADDAFALGEIITGIDAAGEECGLAGDGVSF